MRQVSGALLRSVWQTCSGRVMSSACSSPWWLGCSLIVASLFALDGLHAAFQSPYTVHNDARQHVFWMQRFLDPALFPGDLIAEYFQSVAPFGYAMLYKLFAALGLDPFVVNKILPGILGVLATLYCFQLCTAIFPVPFAGFLSTLLLNQNLWLRDDLASGTPRAFLYPLLLAFLYYVLRGALLPCLATLVLQGLFYPQTVFLSVALLCLRLLRCTLASGKMSQPACDYRLYGASLGTALVVLGLYALKNSDFGPVISASVARNWPEFSAQGRSAFFVPNAWVYWLYAERSGFFPSEWQYVLLFGFGCVLPLLQRSPIRFPLTTRIRRDRALMLVELLLASLGMFIIAHLCLFTLHLPSRYTQHSWRIIMAIANAMVLVIVLQAASTWITQQLRTFFRVKKRLVTLVISSMVVALVLAPSYAVRAYPYRLGYVRGEAPSLYAFLRQQPKDTLVASLTKEADFIPSLAQRSVVVAEEYAIPYHTGYYGPFKQRTSALLDAQYSENLAQVQDFIQRYGVDIWLLEKDTFTPEYVAQRPWLMQFQPAATQAIARMQHGKTPTLSRLTSSCVVFADEQLLALDAQCIMAVRLD